MMVCLKDKVCLITGASSGIGAATAVHFASLGAKLALTGRNLESLKKVQSECEQKGTKHVLVIQADLTDTQECEKIMKATISKFEKLDVLVNNAGTIMNGTIESTSLTDYDKQMNINVRSVFYLTQLAIAHLEKTRGNIVNLSSITGLRAFPGVVAYNMSKAAVDHMTRSVALEMAGKTIRVNSVNPGVIITELHKRGGMSEEQYKKFLVHCKDTHALGRPGNPDEVAKAIAFLASDDASYITGVCLSVDGGRHAMCPR